MPRRRRQNYIDREDFHNALRESAAASKPTLKICELFLLLIRHFLSGARWSGYDPHTLEDLESAALEKCLRNVKNYKAERGSPFTYFTLVTQTAVVDHLKRYHYRQMNIKRDLREMGGVA